MLTAKAKCIWGRTVQEIFDQEKIPPDFEYNRPHIDTELVLLHRQADDLDLYFVANQKNRAEDFETRFRLAGKEPELWHPDTGLIEPADYKFREWPHHRAFASRSGWLGFCGFPAPVVRSCAHFARSREH